MRMILPHRTSIPLNFHLTNQILTSLLMLTTYHFTISTFRWTLSEVAKIKASKSSLGSNPHPHSFLQFSRHSKYNQGRFNSAKRSTCNWLSMATILLKAEIHLSMEKCMVSKLSTILETRSINQIKNAF